MKKFNGFLRGINLGGWLSQGSLEQDHLENFIKENDIRRISEMGLDHVRLPIDYEIMESKDGETKESGFLYIDRCIEWCKKYHLNMILDLHKTAGYIFDDAENCTDFFHNRDLQSRFLSIWERLAERYAKNSSFMAFELLNEVVDPNMADIWNNLAEEAIRTIRTISPDIWILVGGTRNNSIVSLKELKKPYDDKIVFNFHCYEPLIFTHQAAYWVPGMTKDYRLDYPKTNQEFIEETEKHISPYYVDLIRGMDGNLSGVDFFKAYFADAVALANEFNVPLYCGEYGVIDLADPAATLRWYHDIHDAFEELGIGRAAWNYKEKDFGITDEHYASILPELIKYL